MNVALVPDWRCGDASAREPGRPYGEEKVLDDCSDADAIARSITDARAFAIVFDRHAGIVFRFLVRRVGRDTADELLGETFRIAFERRATFDTARESARPWLYGIATNLLAKHRRTEGRRLRATARLAATTAGEGVADAVAGSLDAIASYRAVVDAIAYLPDGERDALLLYAWEHLEYEDIAIALGVPVGTVRSRLNRARARLRELTGGAREQGARRDAAAGGSNRG
jgi:RNA polymerase sigma-70 factor (ECF subfamily)